MTRRIAFIGATGMLGRPVVEQLVATGFDVTALVRNIERAKATLPHDIKFIQGDIRNAGDLERSFQNQDAVYVNLNLRQGERKNDFHAEGEGLDNIIMAAKKAKLGRIAFVSSVVMNYQGMNGFDWWVFRMKHEAVRKVRESGIPYTIFYPSTFMDNFKFTYRRGNKILLAGKSECKMYYISGGDYGKQVARSFQILTNEKKEYIIQGPEAFKGDEAAEVYIQNYNKEKLSTSRAPLGLLKFLGFFSAQIDYGYHIVEALNKYPEKFEAESVWKELGTPTTTLKQFAEGG